MRRETKQHMLNLINDRLDNPSGHFIKHIAGENMTIDEAICLVYGSLALTITEKHALIWDRKIKEATQ